MIVVDWPEGVNNKFYGFNERPKDNIELTEMASGRVVGRKLNTRAIMTFSCSLFLEKRTEMRAFWKWYNDELGGTAGAFKCRALDTEQGLDVENGEFRHYRFTETPEPQDTGQQYRAISMTIEEVY